MEEKTNIQKWFEKTNWTNRPKAVCKPCWEIKYCPYGPLVEDFPLLEESDEKSCRIFGHQCPVFYVAEPFTETKELRRISRQIPRVTQFRVLKRENQICSNCGNSVRDQDIEFDHIIPWSKGGSSEESNIRLLCINCNRKKSNRYEDEYLVKDVSEHITEFSDESTIEFLLFVSEFGNEFRNVNNVNPSGKDFADKFNNGELSTAETKVAEFFDDLYAFFQHEKPVELSEKQFKALKLRWGFSDGIVYTIREIKKLLNMNIDEYLMAEKNLVQRLGFIMSNTKSVITNWKKL